MGERQNKCTKFTIHIGKGLILSKYRYA